MKKVKLGNTGYLVSPVFYAGIVSMQQTQADSDRYTARAVEAGVNYFDVAPSYGDAEEKLGRSLQPYRKQVYLACKTLERKKKEAERELQASLKKLKTDWFDNYQLHSMTTPEDVELAFSSGGAMELLVRMKQEGVIRKIGFSAHSERAAMECLKRYPFDTAMFPINWMLHLGQGIGENLLKAAKERGFGLIALKSLIERAWHDEGERDASPWTKSWCKPFDWEDQALRRAAMKYSLGLGADALIPPGNWESQSFMMEAIDEVADTPMTSDEMNMLKEHFEKVKDQPFFDQNNGNWPEK